MLGSHLDLEELVMRYVKSFCIAALVAVISSCATTNADEQTATPAPSNEAQAANPMAMQHMQHMQQMQGNMARMQALMAQIHATQDPKERQKLMAQHRQAMRDQMQMMHGMMGGGMGMGMKGGMQGGMKEGRGMGNQSMEGMHGMMMQRMDMMSGMMQQMLEHMSAEEGDQSDKSNQPATAQEHAH